MNRSKLVSSANRFLLNQSSASTRSTAFRSTHPERRSDQLLVYEHNQVLRYARIHQIRHRAVVGSLSNLQGAISQCSLGYSLHIACFSSSRHGPFIVGSGQLFHRSNDFIQLLHQSLRSQTILTRVCFCLLFCTSDVGPIQQLLCDPWHICCSGVWDPWSVEYQS